MKLLVILLLIYAVPSFASIDGKDTAEISVELTKDGYKWYQDKYKKEIVKEGKRKKTVVDALVDGKFVLQRQLQPVEISLIEYENRTMLQSATQVSKGELNCADEKFVVFERDLSYADVYESDEVKDLDKITDEIFKYAEKKNDKVDAQIELFDAQITEIGKTKEPTILPVIDGSQFIPTQVSEQDMQLIIAKIDGIEHKLLLTNTEELDGYGNKHNRYSLRFIMPKKIGLQENREKVCKVLKLYEITPEMISTEYTPVDSYNMIMIESYYKEDRTQ